MISKKIAEVIFQFLRGLRTETPGAYMNCKNGNVTLYSSCFALMIYHYLNLLGGFDKDYLNEWGNYILSYQDEKQGYFLGPEITEGRLLSKVHTKEHLALHSTAHVLPALKILGNRPRYPLRFAEKYLDEVFLERWLGQRNWTEPWLEGNNLLFVGQFLTHFYEEEDRQEARSTIINMLDWLEKQVDPNTGLWGTNTSSNKHAAVYGGYHQLLLYYYWDRDVKYKERLIDTVLSIQHIDGGFSRSWGGGSCEDVDAVDILVNMSKRTSYRRKDIISALRKARVAILRRMTREGGFVYRVDSDFIHMGMEYTYAPPNTANMFSTWFAVHTLLLISELIDLPCTRAINYNFNPSCSMGWHRKAWLPKAGFWANDFPKILFSSSIANLYFIARGVKESNKIAEIAYGIVKSVLKG